MTTEQLKQFQENIKLANNSLTKKDFETNFKTLIDFVKKLKEMTAQEMETMRVMLKSFEAKMESDQTSEMTDMKKTAMDYCEKEMNAMMTEHEAMMSAMDKKMTEVKDGKDADEATIALNASRMAQDALKPDLLTIEQVDENTSKKGDLIVKTLSEQVDEEKLHIEDIYRLPELLEELRQLRSKILGGGGGFSRMAMEQYFVDADYPVEVPNGVITDFTPTWTFVASSLKVYNDGQRMKLTTDYTIVNGKVVYNTAPLADVIIIFEYRRA